jgi:hypothetical protein
VEIQSLRGTLDKGTGTIESGGVTKLLTSLGSGTGFVFMENRFLFAAPPSLRVLGFWSVAGWKRRDPLLAGLPGVSPSLSAASEENKTVKALQTSELPS